MRTMTSDDVRRMIAKQAEDVGSVSLWAKRHGVSQAYVAHVLNGRQEPGQKLLEALGIERVTTYRMA